MCYLKISDIFSHIFFMQSFLVKIFYCGIYRNKFTMTKFSRHVIWQRDVIWIFVCYKTENNRMGEQRSQATKPAKHESPRHCDLHGAYK